MIKLMRKYGPIFLIGLLPVLLISCGGSGGGADDGEASVRYQVEMTDGGASCLRRLQYRDGDGNLRTVTGIDSPEWRRTIYARDGARLYLQAEIECGEVTVAIYLDGSRVARARSSTRATVEGILRVDEENNVSFEEN